MPLVDPNTTHVAIQHVSKRQLARMVNEQAERIRHLDAYVMATSRLLIAMSQEPEAFSYQDGTVSIARGAVDKVRAGDRLHIVDHADRVEIRSVAAPAIAVPDTPRVVSPR